MTLQLPEILHDDRYNGMWEWDGAWPVPKDDAPRELVEVLDLFRKEHQSQNGYAMEK